MLAEIDNVDGLAIEDIRRDGGTQIRERIDGERVAEYAEALDALPAVTVFYDGSDYWLADGFHRVAAFERVGRRRVPVEIARGTRRDAILHACGANATHGIRRTNADKRRAVETLLRDEEWAEWSDREIARRAGVSHTFVQKARGQLATVASSPTEPATPPTRIGADGKRRKVPKRPKPKPREEPPMELVPAAEPDASEAMAAVLRDDEDADDWMPEVEASRLYGEWLRVVKRWPACDLRHVEDVLRQLLVDVEAWMEDEG